MRNRTDIIFERICRQGTVTSIDELAQQLSVSMRTIYNDVERLNSLLSRLGKPKISLKRGKLSCEKRIEDSFAQIVGDEELVYIEPGFRRNCIVVEMLCHKDGFSSEELRSSLGISRNTLRRDMRNARTWLGHYGIDIETQQFKGSYITGEEPTIRRALTTALAQYWPYFLAKMPEADSAALDRIEGLVHALEDELALEFSDIAAEHLVIALFAARRRIDLGCFMPPQAEVTGREIEAVRKLRAKVKDALCTHGSAEQAGIAVLLREASVVRRTEAVSENWFEMSLLVKRLIESVGQHYPEALFEKDESLFEGLLNHIRPAYWRAVNREVIDNPMLGYIRENWSDLLAIISHALKPIEAELEVVFPETEAAYFALFFAASLERQNKIARRQATAIVVCHAGVATSQLLRAQVDAVFDINVIAILSQREAGLWLASNDVDLVISTVPLQISGHQVIQVSPALTPADTDRIAHALARFSAYVDIDEVMKIISHHVDLSKQDERNLRQELGRYLGFRPSTDKERGRYEPMLKEVLTKSMVEVGYHAANRDAAVREAGRLLVEGGFAAPEYVDAMIENVEVNGTYIVIAPGIAMPHARPEKGALNIGFSMLTLAEPIAFGHPINDPVKIVIALCAIDHHAHLTALAELAEIIGDEDKLERIAQASSTDDIVKIVEGSN